MSQHFLLSAKARSLSLAKVARLSDEEAYQTFKLIRWADTEGEPVCPRCGCVAVYTYATRKLFKCKACNHQFSVTSRDDLRQPQAPDPRLPPGHRDLRERRQGP